MIVTLHDIEEYLNSFLPKLFYEVKYDRYGITVQVPELVRSRVLTYLMLGLPAYVNITVDGI